MRVLLSLFFFLLLARGSSAQTDTLKKANPVFTDMLVTTENIYALNASGQLLRWDVNTLTRTFISDTTEKYLSIAKDRKNKIYLGTANGKIFTLNEDDHSTQLHLELKKALRISDLYLNSEDELFLIVPNAVYDPIHNKAWANFKHTYNPFVMKPTLWAFLKRSSNYFLMPDHSFLDSQDRIWMTSSFGEFGGSIQIFDTQKRKECRANIDSLNLGLLFPKSVFEDQNQNIYITSGLEHFYKHGQIFCIQNDAAKMVYDSDDCRDTADKFPFGGGIFVGPGAFNSVDNKMYFATTDGFYRASIPNKGRITTPELLFKPELLWGQEPLAIGVSMSVKRLDFTSDNRLVFLTDYNGIGIFDGTALHMIE
jgi:hypothetical protein